MALPKGRRYKLVTRSGIIAIIINKNKVLLLKRRNIPLILNPGIWSFLTGGRNGKERYLETAYREIKEEVNLKRIELELLGRTKAYLAEEKRKVMWLNHLFIFRSKTNRIRLDLENSAFRWAPLSDIAKENHYTNVFINQEPILKRLRGFLDETKGAKGKN